MTSSWSEANRLAGCGSPYLEQHANNPVHWIPWSPEVFEEARRRQVPILVSIGYSTCHWCHVMAHECFEDKAVAAEMNTAFVNVKVDREQHPGVDALYMEAAGAMTGSGGWPMNAFVDDQGRPFLTVTYLPQDRWVALIREVRRIWREEPDRIQTVAKQIAAHLAEKDMSETADTAAWSSRMLGELKEKYDVRHPGFSGGGGGTKFPPSLVLDWLLEYGGPEGRSMGLGILTTMMDSGLHDRVGGGFHRYSVEPTWRIPHFEKMTCDNAQLMGLFARASVLDDSESRSADFQTAARRTADWFLEEMRIEDSTGTLIGYATATDADDSLGEGSFFAWPPEVLKDLLGTEDGTWLAGRWNLSGEGRLPNRHEKPGFKPNPSWIPHPRGAAGYPDSYRDNSSDESRRREQRLTDTLLSERRNRPAPQRDDKVLTDQNALILEGFVRLARYGGGEPYRKAAEELAEILLERFSLLQPYPENRDVLLFRSPGVEAYITDYGYLASALCGICSLTGSAEYALAAERVAEAAIRRFGTGNGDYFATPDGDITLYKRSIEDFEGSSPAGQYALGIAFARLFSLTGNPDWRIRADALLRSRGSLVTRSPMAAPTLLRLGTVRGKLRTCVLAGPENDSRGRQLLRTAQELSGPDTMIVVADRAEASGVDWAELEGRVGLETPSLFICLEGRCLKPAFTGREVRTGLESED